MAFPIQNLPDYTVMDAASYKAAIDSVSANYARRAGGLNVEASATPAMNVRVAAGSYFSSSTNVLTEVAAATTSIGAAPSSPNNRIDRVVYNTASLAVQVIAGSASPTPTVPAIPANCIPLAKVQVNHGTSVITNSLITDERPAYWSLGGGGVVIVRNVYTSGTTWNKDANLLYAEVEVQGGGGGSGGTSSASNPGSGGSSGGYARKIIAAASLGSTETVTIGAAGTAGGSGTDGGAGGTTSFGSHVSATGGGKGLGSGTATPKISDTPGVGSGGDLNLRGEQAWLANTNIGGAGADSYMGGGGSPRVTQGVGITPQSNSGAGAGGSLMTGASQVGQAGAGGICIVTEYRRA